MYFNQQQAKALIGLVRQWPNGFDVIDDHDTEQGNPAGEKFITNPDGRQWCLHPDGHITKNR